MGKREKLIERLTNSPQNATFADIRNLLEYEGFYLDRVTDSHHVFIYSDTIFAVPVRNDKLKALYVEKILELIASADPELEEDD
ncbi:type II toxin-antitoxin system HicA family toxin [Chamaesiphon sp. VAR_69_metabat_338]|uniref:type II toxin-antitoxin system HicA family toxin n=1 Tax=Chamaesiphon sp. VAR_69_metabat_338 TaxID=2964704 RepID=UPI00286E7E2A|nr:type II toxin-antitoxin system HicA family toxin [Chamaesiphon sp. VAR_69_metabat_338]